MPDFFFVISQLSWIVMKFERSNSGIPLTRVDETAWERAEFLMVYIYPLSFLIRVKARQMRWLMNVNIAANLSDQKLT